MSDQLRRPLNVTARILSEKDGTVEYVASDATLDSYDECVLPTGWRFTMFAKNSPFVDSHNYWSIEHLLGKVTGARIEGRQLIENVSWAKDVEENKLARLGWKMTVGGFLKAVSVGFRTLKSAYPSDSAWEDLVRQTGMTPDQAGRCRRIFVEQEQLELSACILGANPAAVAKAYREGCVTDGDLASVGFGDDDMHFLSIAGKALDNAEITEVERLLIGREMRRVTATKNLKTDGTNTNSPAPGNPGADAEARHREEMAKKDFLRKFEALVR